MSIKLFLEVFTKLKARYLHKATESKSTWDSQINPKISQKSSGWNIILKNSFQCCINKTEEQSIFGTKYGLTSCKKQSFQIPIAPLK